VLSFIIIIVLSYLLGSIPTSVWVGKIYKGIDIREHGSGNPGATNTFRMLGWKAGVVVAIIDLSKGFVAAYFISQIGYHFGDLPMQYGVWHTDIFMRIVAGVSAVIGHMFPLYANFKGGKGVITAAGMLYGIEPISISVVLVIFLIVLISSRYVSLASIVASFCYPLVVLLMKYQFGFRIDGSHIIFASLVALAIIIKHIPNIKRLFNGNENRIRSFKPAKGRLNKEQTT